MRLRRVDECIAGYLRSSGMTQEQLAAEVGMSPNTLSWKRRGERGREFSLGELLRLAEVVGPELRDAAAEDVCELLGRA